MRIVPVIDLKGGVVVRGVGGRRDEYRPIVSTLAASSEPVVVAEAFRSHLGLDELYVADLDAISGAPAALELCATLQARGFRLWLDAGLKHADDANSLAVVGIDRIVAGLETLQGPEQLQFLCQRFGERIVFSLDLKQGQPLRNSSGWPETAWDIARAATERGARRLLILDLANVGEGRGTGTEDFCQHLTRTYPHLEISAGGGVRSSEDLRRLHQAGVAAVLVASALHDRRITRTELDELASPDTP